MNRRRDGQGWGTGGKPYWRASAALSSRWAVFGKEMQVVPGDGDALLIGGGAESGEGAGNVFEVCDELVRGRLVSGG